MKNRKPPTFRPAHQQDPAERRKEWRDRWERQAQRPTAQARGYDQQWRDLRARVLVAEPWCRSCAAAGRQVKAVLVDHQVPIRDDPTRRLDPSNCVPMCAACHNRKGLRSDGLMGRPRKPG